MPARIAVLVLTTVIPGGAGVRLVEQLDGGGSVQATSTACLATGADAESNSSGIVLPDCPRTLYAVERVAQESFEWCNPELVAAEERAPAKLQGLYWLKGLPLPDVMACFSTGKWDQEKLTLSVEVYPNFVWRDTYPALATVSALYKLGFTYKVEFKSEALEEAEINPVGGNIFSKAPVFFFNAATRFPYVEQEGTNGEKWSRPSFMGIGPLKVKTNEYEAWKVMDGAGGLLEENHEAMLEALKEEGTEGVMRFPATCDKAVQKKALVKPGSASCSGGLLVTLAGQEALALAHVAEVEGTLATFRTERGCTVTYRTSCANGYVEVTSHASCPEGKRLLKMPKASEDGAFKDHWQVCSDTAGVLSTAHALVDQTWSTAVAAGGPVQGCIRVLAAQDWPELGQVRGDLEQQKAALTARRLEVGGCPLVRNDKERRDRARDFTGGMAPWLGAVQHFQKARAQSWKEGKSASHLFANLVSLGFMGAGAKGNRTTAFTTFGLLNCGEPAPFVNGPQVFRHAAVAGAAGDPHQVRVYSTATVPQNEACFQRTIPLFVSSGTAHHTQFRQLLDSAGFASMHTTAFPPVTARIPDKGAGEAPPTEKVVAKSVLERVMLAVWGKPAPAEVVDAVHPYIDNGKLCIFGQKARDMKLLRAKQVEQISEIREANAQFGVSGPRIQKAVELMKEKYPAVEAAYTEAAEKAGKPLPEVLAKDVGDAVLFAGLLGTSHMTTMCIHYQWRDHKHVGLYRKDKRAYLHELMRYDGAVTSFTTALKQEETWKLEGLDVPLPEATPVQMSLASANRDESVFPNADVFDPERSSIGESLSWNGRLKHVMARNYSGAPRHCPGYETSIAIATQVCDHYTQHLSTFSGTVGSQTTGTVEILTPGDWQGHQAVVSYFDFRTEKLCLIKPEERPTVFVGCFKSTELKVIDPTPVFPRTWEDEASKCPKTTDFVANLVAKSAFQVHDEDSFIMKLKEKVLGKDELSEHLNSRWADDYTTAFYALTVHGALRTYVTRHKDLVNIPLRTGEAESFKVGDVVAPNLDIDDLDLHPSLLSSLSQSGVLPNANCLQNVLRKLDFEDDLNTTGVNTWEVALQGKYKRKRDWVLAFYSMYTAKDGTPVWPKQELDLSQLFLKGDVWDDRLEMSMAFDLIAAHRVEVVERSHGGETLPFVVRLNDFSKLAVRPGFGIYQGDLYFTAQGMPALIELADGTVVQAGDKDWQYWKFVWRSALTTVITLVDHLHTTHFKAANHLARVSRKTLSPDHPVRRLLSVFTFGSISVNLNAMHALAGPNHALHRSSPFRDFESLSAMVPKMLPDLLEQHRPLYDDKAFEAMPKRLQSAAYFADGRLLFGAIYKMLKGYMEIHKELLCTDSEVKELELVSFRKFLAQVNEISGFTGTSESASSCDELTLRLATAVWTVTGWHRHVGSVADYYVDPDLASFSWKDGEAFPRPRQMHILSVIAAFTGTGQPKLSEDYSHVFRGLEKEDQVLALWQDFRRDLQAVKEAVRENNLLRGAVPNFQADPDIVECSVAV